MPSDLSSEFLLQGRMPYNFAEKKEIHIISIELFLNVFLIVSLVTSFNNLFLFLTN